MVILMTKNDFYPAVREIVAAYFSGKDLSEETKQLISTEENLMYLYNAARWHDMAHLVSVTLDNLGLMPENSAAADEFHNAQMVAIYRYQMGLFDEARYKQILEENEIEFMPLKGALIRQYYPEPYLRTSCDIDILIHPEDLPRATKALTDAGFTTDEKKGSHDVSFYSNNGTHLELHFTLYEKLDIDEIWRDSIPAEGCKYHRLMNRNMFYAHQVAHCAKHFVYGGCGIRLFLDMWLILEAEAEFDRSYVDRVLSGVGILSFEKTAREMAYVWFSGREYTALTRDMEDYIFKSGIYGNIENKVITTQRKKGGMFKYAMSRIFMPRKQLTYYYPSLEKHKWLLPYFEVCRWFRLAFRGGAKRSMREMKDIVTVDDEKKNRVLNLLDKLDLE